MTTAVGNVILLSEIRESESEWVGESVTERASEIGRYRERWSGRDIALEMTR